MNDQKASKLIFSKATCDFRRFRLPQESGGKATAPTMSLGVHSIPLPLRYLLRRFGTQWLMILGAVFLYYGLVKKGVLSVKEWTRQKASSH